MDSMQHLRKWRVFAPLGLICIGTGASMLGEAIIAKSGDAPLGEWFVWGTAALVVFNAGIAIFGEAIKSRVMHEVHELRKSQ